MIDNIEEEKKESGEFPSIKYQLNQDLADQIRERIKDQPFTIKSFLEALNLVKAKF
jgi:hypothetical protein